MYVYVYNNNSISHHKESQIFRRFDLQYISYKSVDMISLII